MCTLLPAHHKSSPHPHHPADPLHPFALPHLPFKRSSFLNLESLHLPYFSYIWKEGQEDLFPMFSHALKFSACRPSFPVRGRFHPELKSQRSCVMSSKTPVPLFTAAGSGSPGTLYCFSVLLTAYRTDSINGAVSFSVSLLEFG